MVINPNLGLAFIHIPKTAGVTITEALGGSSSEYRTHAPASDLTPEDRKLTTFAVVRNPLDWYVSNYFFKISGNKGFKEVGSFEDFMEDMLFISERTKRWFKPWPRVDPQKMIDPVLQAGRTDIGFFTVNLLYYCFSGFETMLAGRQPLNPGILGPRCLVANILRLERLGAEFAEMVQLEQLPVDPYLMSRQPKKNTSQHREFSEYYTDELEALVREKDALTFDLVYAQTMRKGAALPLRMADESGVALAG